MGLKSSYSKIAKPVDTSEYCSNFALQDQKNSQLKSEKKSLDATTKAMIKGAPVFQLV